MPKNQSFIPLLKQIAFEAGEKILDIYYAEDFEINLKSDKSPITEADLLAHQIIYKKLESTGIPILSEEGKSISYQERKKWNKFWMIDPIDGTKEFIKRNDEFTINIALIENQKPILGLVYAPAFDKLYFGGIEMGAFLQENKNPPKELFIPKKNNTVLRIATSRSHLNKKTKTFIENLKQETKTIPVGSSLKFMLLAENKIDIYPRFSPCMEWDTAAAHAILSGMNIEIINAENHKPLLYNKENLYNPNFIVKTKCNLI